ncbi:phosphoglycerate kinase [Candidatus Parcubacteria bacterium]|nr:MAG: phosphoglycerate kinase [Candidatus Parcubacteria bacterium]
MNLPSIKNLDVRGKRALTRVDFNVLFNDGRVEDLYRISKTIPTIEYLRDRGARTILISHLSSGKNGSLSAIAEYLNQNSSVPVKFIKQKSLREIKKETDEMKDGDVVLIENLRLFPGEENNDPRFAEELAKLGDVYVNDAFSSSHRGHASIVGLPKYLPSYIGFLFEKEMEGFRSVFEPSHPFLFILGGVKIETKLSVLDKFLEIADSVFVGGALANSFLKAKGFDTGDSVVSEKISVEKYLGNPKMFFPVDVKKKDGKIFDIGEETIAKLLPIIKEAKFILWNGPVGNIEERDFDKGTKVLAQAVLDSGAKAVVGGGDTVAVLNQMGILDKFSFVSTAGGAMLEFLATGTLPGIEAIKIASAV